MSPALGPRRLHLRVKCPIHRIGALVEADHRHTALETLRTTIRGVTMIWNQPSTGDGAFGGLLKYWTNGTQPRRERLVVVNLHPHCHQEAHPLPSCSSYTAITRMVQ